MSACDRFFRRYLSSRTWLLALSLISDSSDVDSWRRVSSSSADSFVCPDSSVSLSASASASLSRSCRESFSSLWRSFRS
jgi:hypothetical protein